MKLKQAWKLLFGVLLLGCWGGLQAQTGNYQFTTVENDPLHVQMYTLDNGMQVFLSVNKTEPRIQAYIPVRVGSKHDPLETTGLAHYFEHMMFKGTSHFGTMDFEQENVLLQAIADQFEVYRNLTDSAERAAAYRVIDSLSYEASKLAIPNEYDKLMTSIGSTGTNAGTSYDFTIYIENVPSNQLENWAKVQSERLENMVLRLFHTEIETVYEEKNMSLTDDNRRVSELILSTLFPHHPYGIHNVLGLGEHLKNPSLKNIQAFYETYYVPNNMAVVLSGDFDPQEAMAIIEKYFGKLQPKEIPEFSYEKEAPLEAPVEKEVVGLEAERVVVAFPMGGSPTKEAILGDLVANMLYNGQAGLYDLELNQAQKVMFAYAYPSTLVDYGVFMLGGMPKAGQTLEEVKDLMLEGMTRIKDGDFPAWMLEATIDNKKYELYKELESNEGRGMKMAFAYIEGTPWKEAINYIDELSKVTKEDVMNFAAELLARNYVVVYKRQGEPTDIHKVDKPAITPIVVNRDVESQFLTDFKVAAAEVEPIEPQFIDYAKDIEMTKIGKKVDLYYMHNHENPTFELTYLFEMGDNNDLLFGLAASYLEYLGTSKLSAPEIRQEFYKIACSYSVTTTSDRIYVRLSGLSENMEKAVTLFENLIKDCQPDEMALQGMKADLLKLREDNKSNQNENVSALVSYATYGPNSPVRHTLSNEQLLAVTSSELIKKLQTMFHTEHAILYYGPETMDAVAQLMTKLHKLPKKMLPIPDAVRFEPLPTTENRVVFAPYDAKQAYCYTISRGDLYERDMMPLINMYNSYFGGGMNAIVFQELREKRSLAYQSASLYRRPNQPDNYFMNMGLIITQNDKVVDAFKAIGELYENMPQSEKGLELAKISLISDLRTSRDQKTDKIFRYLSDKKYGYTEDSRKVMYEAIPGITMEDIVKFQAEKIKGHPQTYIILGKESDFDFEQLEREFGKVEKLTTEEIFGY